MDCKRADEPEIDPGWWEQEPLSIAAVGSIAQLTEKSVRGRPKKKQFPFGFPIPEVESDEEI